jgi:tetratricopeptide (TPR) repeat protein
MAIGDFSNALTDFQRAAVLAQDDPGSKLRLYEIQLKLAEVSGLLGDYANSVNLYSTAIDFAGLRERAQAKSANLTEALEAADSAAQGGDYQEAYKKYREAVALSTQAFDTVEHVVASGEYLSSIALDYNSTIGLIAQANGLANPNLIITGQVLLIPILP